MSFSNLVSSGSHVFMQYFLPLLVHVGNILCWTGRKFAARNLAVSAALFSVQFNTRGTGADTQRPFYRIPEHTQGQVCLIAMLFTF